MAYLLVIISSYIIGSSSMTLYLSLLKGIDIRTNGTGNLGASNAVVVMGWKAGILVAAHDIGKAALCVWAAEKVFPMDPIVGAIAGISCVIGHMFPFYLKFKGGKGLASYIGMTLALNWKFGLCVILAVILITIITDYIVLGAMTTITVVPTYVAITQQNLILVMILLVGTACMVYKHRENFVRLKNGTEIGLRRTARGEDRIYK